MFVKALKYLVEIGYELEERNSEGRTPFLHATTVYAPQVVKCLRAFIEAGSDVHATDPAGQGALHCALSAQGTFVDCRTQDFINPFSGDTDHYWHIHSQYNTEDEDYLEDYNDVYFKFGHECFANELAIDNILCHDWWGMDKVILDPNQVLKERLRFKLFHLLEVGCDLNLINKAGRSPSDYAEENGVWPQWRWALVSSGYVYNQDSGRCVKGSEFQMEGMRGR